MSRVEARRTFVPVLVPGVLAAALAAVAAAKAWAAPGSGLASRLPGGVGLTSAGQVPLASAVSLVVLAAWGAVLVTRGRLRRVFAGVGLVAALVLLGTTIRGASTAQDTLRRTLDGELGLPDGSARGADIGLTGWYWTALVASVLCVATFALAVRYAAAWPGMSARYDAPGDETPAEEPRTNAELWKALDEGHDPTARRDP